MSCSCWGGRTRAGGTLRTWPLAEDMLSLISCFARLRHTNQRRLKLTKNSKMEWGLKRKFCIKLRSVAMARRRGAPHSIFGAFSGTRPQLPHRRATLLPDAPNPPALASRAHARMRRRLGQGWRCIVTRASRGGDAPRSLPWRENPEGLKSTASASSEFVDIIVAL